MNKRFKQKQYKSNMLWAIDVNIVSTALNMAEEDIHDVVFLLSLVKETYGRKCALLFLTTRRCYWYTNSTKSVTLLPHFSKCEISGLQGSHWTWTQSET